MSLGLVIALAFVTHALGTPPTNGANVFDPRSATYTPTARRPGAGEVVALVLLLGGAGRSPRG